MNILVTGGSGFIGSALVRHLVLERGMRVLNLDSLTYAANPLSLRDLDGHSAYTQVQADIADRAAVDAAFAQAQPDAVIHLAAESHVDRSIESPGDFIRTNVTGTFILLEAARAYWQSLPEPRRSAFRFLHVSTDEVFGSLGPTGAFSEDSPYAPNSPYAASKASADHLARAWHVTYGMPVIVSNCSNNYGPRQFPEKLIPLMILNAVQGKKLPIYGDGLQIRDWLYVDDHARALADIVTRAQPGSRYMIGGDAEKTNREVVVALCEALDRLNPGSPQLPHSSLMHTVTDRPGHDRRYAADFSRLTTDLGWKPSLSFTDGLERTIAWYLDNAVWCEACGGAATMRRGVL
jgi:dTDP-glucose 4,6-dehydratase